MGTPLRNVVGAGAEKIVCWLLSKAASAMSLVPFLIMILADGLQSRSYTTNFHRRQGAAASYGAPSGGKPVMASYNNNSPLQQSRLPKSITIPLPDFDIGQIIREKENILGSIVNIKKILLSPVVGIGRQIVDTKLNLVLPLIQPVIGFKRTGLEFLRGLIGFLGTVFRGQRSLRGKGSCSRAESFRIRIDAGDRSIVRARLRRSSTAPPAPAKSA